LSVHLRFGTVSIRALARIGNALNEKWLNELIWRDFYMMILWHFPHVVHQAFKPQYDKVQWRNNEKEFEAWCKGQTGYPIVDAGMRELNATGFMHNRVRMITASFLVKHLLIDWRWGEAYFAEKLLDFDLSANNGSWQWAASSGCDAAPYFRVFNPLEQTKKFDGQLQYIRKWVPEFNSFSYVRPIVEHKFARERVLKVYKTAVGSNEVAEDSE
jgi:deoxyribodipyrimidine photo-lyase